MKTKIKVAALLLISSILSSNVIADEHSTEMLVNTCVACHGEGGNSMGPAIPNIAGISPNYFMAAMLAYKYDDDEDKLDEVIEEDPDYEDVEAFPRFSTIMGRIAKGYTEEEIKQMAEYFSSQELVYPRQAFDTLAAEKGGKLHTKHCEKCHENEGRSAEFDTGVLAGQWIPYFMYTMTDFREKHRDMPKKMKKEVESIDENIGVEGWQQLADYYASIQD
ncbi:MAG: c-type cytochrome [Pseudomonadota bacterium]